MRYLPKHNNLTVSQEFTIIELAIGAAAVAAAPKLIKLAKKVKGTIEDVKIAKNADEASLKFAQETNDKFLSLVNKLTFGKYLIACALIAKILLTHD